MHVRRSGNSVEDVNKISGFWSSGMPYLSRCFDSSVIGINSRLPVAALFWSILGVPLHRRVRIWTWSEVSDDVYGVTGVVLDFQTLQIQQLLSEMIQVPDSKIRRLNF